MRGYTHVSEHDPGHLPLPATQPLLVGGWDLLVAMSVKPHAIIAPQILSFTSLNASFNHYRATKCNCCDEVPAGGGTIGCTYA